MNERDKFWHRRYEEADDSTREMVDQAFNVARKSLEANGLIPANDDRAECLVAAIMRYVHESRRHP